MTMPVKRFPRQSVRPYDDIRPELRTGDLLFCSGSLWTSELIQAATSSVWSHVAFVVNLKQIDRVMVLESVESQGVRSVPLSKYLRNYDNKGHAYPGDIAIARHRRFSALGVAGTLRRFGQQAVDRFGYPYDRDEIAKITARIAGSYLPFRKKTRRALRRDDEFICSEYVYECYRAVGIEVDHDRRGFIAPADFARDGSVEMLAVLQKKP